MNCLVILSSMFSTDELFGDFECILSSMFSTNELFGDFECILSCMLYTDELFGDFEDLETGERHGGAAGDGATGSDGSHSDEDKSSEEDEPYRGTVTLNLHFVKVKNSYALVVGLQ